MFLSMISRLISRSLTHQVMVALGMDSARHVKLTMWLFQVQASRMGVRANDGGNSTVMWPFLVTLPPVGAKERKNNVI